MSLQFLFMEKQQKQYLYVYLFCPFFCHPGRATPVHDSNLQWISVSSGSQSIHVFQIFHHRLTSAYRFVIFKYWQKLRLLKAKVYVEF